MAELTTAQAVEALTDIALFITIYVSLVATIYGIGEPRTEGERVGRLIGLWTCAICGVLITIWLIVGLLIRVGLVVVVH